MPERRIVRTALGADRWFPGDRQELSDMVTGFIGKAAPPAIRGRIVGAIAPHAGYVYSGAAAGWTFRAIRDNAATHGQPETVVVLGFGHRAGFRGVALMDGAPFGAPGFARLNFATRPALLAEGLARLARAGLF